MTIPKILQSRIRARKDTSDEESLLNSEAQGTASETESALEAGLSDENAVDLEEDTSNEEVGITPIISNDLSDSSSNLLLLPRLSPTTQ